MATVEESEQGTFEDLGLHTELLRNIQEYGFTNPSEFQNAIIPVMVSRKSVIAKAQSGVGKTAAYAISLLQIVETQRTICKKRLFGTPIGTFFSTILCGSSLSRSSPQDSPQCLLSKLNDHGIHTGCLLKRSIADYAGVQYKGSAVLGEWKKWYQRVGHCRWHGNNCATNHLQGIIVVPTRELACGISKVFSQLSSKTTAMAFTESQAEWRTEGSQFQALHQHQVQVVILTTGRLLELMIYSELRFDWLKVLVLDEVHDLLSRGFEHVLLRISGLLPPQNFLQVWLMTSGYNQYDEPVNSKEIELASKFIESRPHCLTLHGDPGLTLLGVKQFYFPLVGEEQKLDAFCKLYESGALSMRPSVVFCNSKRKSMWLADKLTARGIAVLVVHNDMEQHECDTVENEWLHAWEEHGSNSGDILPVRIFITSSHSNRCIHMWNNFYTSVAVLYDIPVSIEEYMCCSGVPDHSDPARFECHIDLLEGDDKAGNGSKERPFATNLRAQGALLSYLATLTHGSAQDSSEVSSSQETIMGRVVVSFVCTADELSYLQSIETHYDTNIQELPATTDGAAASEIIQHI